MHDERPSIRRSAIAIGLEPRLRSRFAELANGRTLAIDFFISRLCTSIVVGDLELRWLATEPGGHVWLPDGFVALAPIEGVGMAADERLLELLAASGPTIVEGGPLFARHLGLRLEDAAAWIDFLESPRSRRPVSLT